MGRIRGLAKRALSRIARVVAKDELFERPGEAGPPPAPLPRADAPAEACGIPGATDDPSCKPAPAAAAPTRASAHRPSEPTAAGRALALPWHRPAGAVRADLDALQALLRPGGGLRLVAHWATWCISCVEELPELRAVEARWAGQLSVFGVSWDLFDPRGDEDDIVHHVEQFGAGHGLRWPSAVVALGVEPTDFFDALAVTFDKVPQTWLVGGDGAVRWRLEGPLTAEAAIGLDAAIRAALAEPAPTA